MKKDFLIAGALTAYSVYKGAHSIPISLIAGIITTVVWWGCNEIWHSDSKKTKRIFQASFLIIGSVTLFIASTKYISNQKLKSYIPQDQLEQFQKTYVDHTKTNIKQFIQERILKLKVLTLDNDISLRDLIDESRKINEFLEDPWINDFEEEDLNALKDLHKIIIEALLDGLQKNNIDISAFVRAERLATVIKKMVLNKDQIALLKPLALGNLVQFAQRLRKIPSTKEGRASFKRAFSFDDCQLLEPLINDPEFKNLAIDIFRSRTNQIEVFLGNSLKLDFNRYIEVFIPKLSETVEGKKKILNDLKQVNKITLFFVETIINIAEINNEKEYNLDDLIKKAQPLLNSKVNQTIKSSSFNNFIIQ